MKSLQLRLIIGLLISLILTFIALWWLASTTMRHLAEDTVSEHLKHDAEKIFQAIHIGANQLASIDQSKIEPIYSQPLSGSYFQATINGQTLRSTSLENLQLNIPQAIPGTGNPLRLSGPEQHPMLAYVYSNTKQQQAIQLTVAEDLLPNLTRLDTFEYQYGLIAFSLLLISIAVQIAILRRGFKPLNQIKLQIRALDQGEIWELDPNVPMEVAELVNEVNWLLKTLEQRLQRSRHDVADLAHALKTPLTVLQQLCREPVLHEHEDLGQSIQLQTTNMQRMIDRVLKRARLAGSGSTKLKFNINQELPALIKALQRMYRDKHLTIEYYAPETGTLPIDREDMLELVGNLLDNACKWANSTVRLTLNVNSVIDLIIEDDGPGVSEQHINSLAKRGTRLDEDVHGTGLGLAIAQLITEQHDGQLDFRRSDILGGFCVEATLRLI